MDVKVIELDATSRKIIEQLQADGRRSYATIAKAVGLSEAAVRQRVAKLTETGVIQIVAVSDPMQVGFKRSAQIGIKVEGDLEALAEKISKYPEAAYVVICAGSFDLMIEVVCEDDEHLLEFLNKKIRGLAGVVSTETFMYLKIHKQTYSWGTR
jgi:Lrp/AsnC family transcriptional regulator, regulator for asnA, asnC and gidA